MNHWYMLAADGRATLCADKADAEQEARDADTAWPDMGPHRAAQLVEAGEAFAPADMATASADGFRAGQASMSLPAAGQEPVAWRLRNTAFRSEVYEYFKTRYLAECRQKQFNASVDDGGLHDLTPLYTHPAPPQAAPAEGDALDAKRYRFLRDEASKPTPRISIGIWGVNGNCHAGRIGASAEDVDAAIDAALAAQKGGAA